MIGLTIGLAFAFSFVIAPFLARSIIGVPGIFALTGLLALGAIAVVRLPECRNAPDTGPREPVRWSVILKDGQLMRINFGMFALHAILMALFLVVPFRPDRRGSCGARPLDALSRCHRSVRLALVVPVIRSGWAETRRSCRWAAGLMAFCLIALALLPRNLWAMAGTLTLFFTCLSTCLKPSCPR